MHGPVPAASLPEAHPLPSAANRPDPRLPRDLRHDGGDSPLLHLIALLEERVVRDRFGPAYADYAARVPRYPPRRG